MFNLDFLFSRKCSSWKKAKIQYIKKKSPMLRNPSGFSGSIPNTNHLFLGSWPNNVICWHANFRANRWSVGTKKKKLPLQNSFNFSTPLQTKENRSRSDCSRQQMLQFPEWSLRESSPLSLEVFMLSSIRLSADSVLCATVAEWKVSLSSPFQLCNFYSRAAFFRLGQRVEPSHLGLSELCQQSALFEFVPENVAAV